MIYLFKHIFILFIIFFSFFSIGKIFFKNKINLSLCFLIGADIFSLFLTFLCFTHLLYAKIIIICIVALFLYGIYLFFKYRKIILSNIYELFSNLKLLDKFYIFIIFLFILLFFILSFAPPTGWDSTVYHLTLSKIFFNNHGFIDRPDILNSTFPFYADILYTIGFAFNIISAASGLQFMFFFICLFLIYQIAKTFFTFINPFLSLLIFLSVPLLSRSVMHPTAEYYCLSNMLAGFYFLLSFIKYHKKKSILIASVFFAFAAGGKYNYLFFIIPLYLAIFFNTKFKKILISINLFILSSIIFVLLLSPFLINNFKLTKNPVYPFFNNLFQSKTPGMKYSLDKDSPSILNNLVKKGMGSFTQKGIKRKLSNIFIFLFELTLNFQKFDYWRYSIGPLFLILIFPSLLFFIFNLKLFSVGDKKIIIFLFICSFLFNIFIFYLAQYGKYFFPITAILAILCCLIFLYKSKVLTFVLSSLILISVIFNLSYISLTNFHRIQFLTYLNADKFLIKYFPEYKAVKFINKFKNSKKFILEKRCFYFQPGFVCATPYIPRSAYFDYSKLKNPVSLYSHLKKNKFDLIFFNKWYVKRFLPQIDFYKIINQLKKYRFIKKIYSDEKIEIFKII